jgi:DNA-binding CsgD family transcriptional regulator
MRWPSAPCFVMAVRSTESAMSAFTPDSLVSSWAALRLDHDLQVIDVAPCSAALMARNHEHLHVKRHRLHAPAVQALLDRRLMAAATGQSGGLLIARPHATPLTLLCDPDGQASSARRGIHIWVRDPELEVVSAERLRQLFGLTATEAAVAAALASGLRSDDIARIKGVQPNSVLMHIKRILAKTGTPHQVALLSLLLRSAATHTPPRWE